MRNYTRPGKGNHASNNNNHGPSAPSQEELDVAIETLCRARDAARDAQLAQSTPRNPYQRSSARNMAPASTSAQRQTQRATPPLPSAPRTQNGNQGQTPSVSFHTPASRTLPPDSNLSRGSTQSTLNKRWNPPANTPIRSRTTANTTHSGRGRNASRGTVPQDRNAYRRAAPSEDRNRFAALSSENETVEIEVLEDGDEMVLAFTEQGLSPRHQRILTEWIENATEERRTGDHDLQHWLDKLGPLCQPMLRYILGCVISSFSNFSPAELQGLAHLSYSQMKDIVGNNGAVPNLKNLGTLDSHGDHEGKRPPSHYRFFCGEKLATSLANPSEHQNLELSELRGGLFSYIIEVHSDPYMSHLFTAISKIDSKTVLIKLLTECGAFRDFTRKVIQGRPFPNISLPRVPPGTVLRYSKRQRSPQAPTEQPKRRRTSRWASRNAGTGTQAQPTQERNTNNTPNVAPRPNPVPSPPASTGPDRSPAIDQPAQALATTTQVQAPRDDSPAPAPTTATQAQAPRNVGFENAKDLDRVNPSKVLRSAGYNPLRDDDQTLSLQNALATLYPGVPSSDLQHILELSPTEIALLSLQPGALHNVIMHLVHQQTSRTHGFGQENNATNQMYEQQVQFLGRLTNPDQDAIQLLAAIAISENHVITFLQEDGRPTSHCFPTDDEICSSTDSSGPTHTTTVTIRSSFNFQRLSADANFAPQAVTLLQQKRLVIKVPSIQLIEYPGPDVLVYGTLPCDSLDALHGGIRQLLRAMGLVPDHISVTTKIRRHISGSSYQVVEVNLGGDKEAVDALVTQTDVLSFAPRTPDLKFALANEGSHEALIQTQIKLENSTSLVVVKGWKAGDPFVCRVNSATSRQTVAEEFTQGPPGLVRGPISALDRLLYDSRRPTELGIMTTMPGPLVRYLADQWTDHIRGGAYGDPTMFRDLSFHLPDTTKVPIDVLRRLANDGLLDASVLLTIETDKNTKLKDQLCEVMDSLSAACAARDELADQVQALELQIKQLTDAASSDEEGSGQQSALPSLQRAGRLTAEQERTTKSAGLESETRPDTVAAESSAAGADIVATPRDAKTTTSAGPKTEGLPAASDPELDTEERRTGTSSADVTAKDRDNMSNNAALTQTKSETTRVNELPEAPAARSSYASESVGLTPPPGSASFQNQATSLLNEINDIHRLSQLPAALNNSSWSDRQEEFPGSESATTANNDSFCLNIPPPDHWENIESSFLNTSYEEGGDGGSVSTGRNSAATLYAPSDDPPPIDPSWERCPPPPLSGGMPPSSTYVKASRLIEGSDDTLKMPPPASVKKATPPCARATSLPIAADIPTPAPTYASVASAPAPRSRFPTDSAPKNGSLADPQKGLVSLSKPTPGRDPEAAIIPPAQQASMEFQTPDAVETRHKKKTRIEQKKNHEQLNDDSSA